MVHSIMVAPRWIEGTHKLWYEWENTHGTTRRGRKTSIMSLD